MRTSTSEKSRRGETLRGLIEREARRAGFDAVAVAAPGAIPDAQAALRRFVAEGMHGSMAWMEETLDRRASPAALWPEVRSVVVLGMNYGPDADPRAVLARRPRSTVDSMREMPSCSAPFGSSR